MKTEELIADYLRKPYSRTLIPEPDGSYFAGIDEFPGCIATGKTISDAATVLEEVAEEWLAAELEAGHQIPEPIERGEYSGRLVLRLPRSLHRRIARLAQRDGVSLNQFIVTSIASSAGAKEVWSMLPQPHARVMLVADFFGTGASGTAATEIHSVGSNTTPTQVKYA